MLIHQNIHFGVFYLNITKIFFLLSSIFLLFLIAKQKEKENRSQKRIVGRVRSLFAVANNADTFSADNQAEREKHATKMITTMP